MFQWINNKIPIIPGKAESVKNSRPFFMPEHGKELLTMAVFRIEKTQNACNYPLYAYRCQCYWLGCQVCPLSQTCKQGNWLASCEIIKFSAHGKSDNFCLLGFTPNPTLWDKLSQS